MASNPESMPLDFPASLSTQYRAVRALSVELCQSLNVEDTVVQSMPDVSPTKWHLAHVTWFWERFVLEAHALRYRVYNDEFDFILNSYYYTAGQMYSRPKRGLLTRPTLAEVLDYRQYVDDAMLSLIDANADDPKFAFLVALGINHEQQHQELLLTDIKHVLSCNPMLPAVKADLPMPPERKATPLSWSDVEGGIQRMGAHGDGFCFDNETPRHDALLADHSIAGRLITNGEYREFIADGGYGQSSLWLSDGWATVVNEGFNRPLYWNEELTSEYTLAGVRDIDDAAPVAHVSFYEADAFARWAGCRLPTEFEWERSASQHVADGNLLESGYWHPVASNGEQQYFGDVWEWTASAYAPYPGFKPLEGSLGEYNGKFMCNQMSVRGGSCITSTDHIRASYRSFFYPHMRWQYLGFRLAKDGSK